MQTKPPLWPHQQQAKDFVNGKPSAMLAMAMRTGKSRVAIELLEERQAKKVLILCPSSVVDVWPEQFKQYATGDWSVMPLRVGPLVKRTEQAKKWLGAKPFVVFSMMQTVIINYEAFWREPFYTWAMNQEWDAIVFDEMHRLKAPGGVASRKAHRLALRVPFKLGLTGTPMPHNPLDIYAQYRILDSSIFGTQYARMKENYAIQVTVPMGFTIIKGYKNLDDLNEKFYRIAFKVDADVLNLPEPLHINRFCELSPKAKRIYRDLEKDFYAEVEEGEITAANAMVKALRLQQVTSGYAKVSEIDVETIIDDSKRKLLLDILTDLNEPVVAFCRFRHDLDAVRNIAENLEWESLELSGRVNQLDAWQKSDNPKSVLAAQIQAGGVGIDLSRAKIAIYYSLGLSLGDHLQSLARMQALGQTHSLAYYYLLAQGTVDEKVARALADRKDVIEEILKHDK